MSIASITPIVVTIIVGLAFWFSGKSAKKGHYGRACLILGTGLICWMGFLRF